MNVRRNETWHRILGVTVGICVMVMVIGFLMLFFRMLALAESNNEVVDQIRESQRTNTRILRLVEDCTIPTDPPTECEKQSAKRTADAVSIISAETQFLVVSALACDRGLNDTVEEIEACVRREIRARTK